MGGLRINDQFLFRIQHRIQVRDQVLRQVCKRYGK